jgi:hypothetical protein
MRLLVQSTLTGRFLVPSPDGGEPVWVRSLREAGGGVVTDLESAHQLVIDCIDLDDFAQVVDLERLGTSNDYPL